MDDTLINLCIEFRIRNSSLVNVTIIISDPGLSDSIFYSAVVRGS